jgi:hypothetical protein
MHITRRLGHRAYQRIRAEHLAEEARRASASADDDTPPPKPTKESRERERAEEFRDRYGCPFLLDLRKYAAISWRTADAPYRRGSAHGTAFSDVEIPLPQDPSCSWTVAR